MLYSKVYIDAFGYELPPNVVTSDDLELRLAPLYKTLHLQKGQLEAITASGSVASGIRGSKCMQAQLWPGKKLWRIPVLQRMMSAC